MNKIRLSQVKTAGYLLILIAVMLLTGSFVGAETVTWNAAGGSWHDDTKWTPAKVPLPVDDAVISGSGTVAVDADVTINSLTMGTGAGSLALNSGTFLIDPSDMVLVPQGAFSIGDKYGDGFPNELPVHPVILSSFAIDKYEVTQKAYQAAMGTNPSYFRGDNLPVESVTWSEADSYCTAVGKRLPTEAEWEYAASNGNQNQKYAGTSSDAELGNYAWYWDNSGGMTHPVGQKLPNSLGTYDMSGNVWEWVADWFGAYSSDTQINPQGPATGTSRVFRGGGWYDLAVSARASNRSYFIPGVRDVSLGFRCARTEMVLVPEGCFQMGDTFGVGVGHELPVHQVCLDSFYIDATEITQAAYQAAMGNNPSYFTGDSSRPVERVTWYNANDYCQAVGKRLPTEAEWEYAARSGGQDQKYSGTSSDAAFGNYAWYWDNSGSTTHPVGQKLPNGLGLYDMSGNVWEWVADWRGVYSSDTQNNPQGPATGTYRVARGGGWYFDAINSRASYRGYDYPGNRYNCLGFRCARTN